MFSSSCSQISVGRGHVEAESTQCVWFQLKVAIDFERSVTTLTSNQIHDFKEL